MKSSKTVIGLLALVFTWGVLGHSALADDKLKITTGSPTLSYHGKGRELLGQLRDGHELAAELVTSNGGWQNLQRVGSGEAHIGFAQADTVALYYEKNASAPLEVVGSIGEECVFIVANKAGKVDDEDDLQGGDKPVIIVGTAGSGSAKTWGFMTKLEPGYKKAKRTFGAQSRSIGRMMSGRQIDALMWVQDGSDMGTKMFTELAKYDGKVELIDVDDSNLNNTIEGGPMDGQQVYTFREIETPLGEVEVPCTGLLVIMNSNVTDKQRTGVEDIVGSGGIGG